MRPQIISFGIFLEILSYAVNNTSIIALGVVCIGIESGAPTHAFAIEEGIYKIVFWLRRYKKEDIHTQIRWMI